MGTQTLDRTQARFYPARAGRSCRDCGNPIEPGTLLAWFPVRGADRSTAGLTFHKDCLYEVRTEDTTGSDFAYRDVQARWAQRCDGCGNRIQVGETVRLMGRKGSFHPGHESMAVAIVEVNLLELPMGTTRYAAEDDAGKLHFVKVDHIEFLDGGQPTKYGGNLYVKAKYGQGEWDRWGKQELSMPAYRGIHADVMARIATDPGAAAIRYGRELGECSRCGRDLTDPESRRLGIGPVCAETYGINVATAPAAGQELGL